MKLRESFVWLNTCQADKNERKSKYLKDNILFKWWWMLRRAIQEKVFQTWGPMTDQVWEWQFPWRDQPMTWLDSWSRESRGVNQTAYGDGSLLLTSAIVATSGDSRVFYLKSHFRPMHLERRTGNSMREDASFSLIQQKVFRNDCPQSHSASQEWAGRSRYGA